MNIFKKKLFKVISWNICMKLFSLNIWFSDYLKLERTKILYEYLLENNFDVILLQEVTLPVLSIIYNKITEKYPYIHFDIEENFYGVCIISKFEINERQVLKFKNSKMQRCLIFGKINDIMIATTHLESEFGKTCNKKVDQLNDSIKILSKYDKVCFIGDTNLTPKNDKDLILNEFKDIYLQMDGSIDNKYTYDGINNPLLSNKIRSRIDRAYIKNLKPILFKLDKEFIMSDHFGILVDISY